MSALISLLAVIIAIVLVWAGVTGAGLQYFFGVILPYTAIAIFIVGVVYRVIGWARSPVPFRIPTTCGQQKSLDWIKPDSLEAPPSAFHAFMRMALEVLFFRSLFRNTKAQLLDGPRIVYGPTKWLWMAGLAFHWTFLIVLIRHFKYFAEPTPDWILTIQNLDGFFQVGLPIFYLTDGIILASLTYLFVRRIVSPQLRYLSMAGDYFPLFLLGAIITTGGIMRYTTLRVDITDVKMLATGLASFSPVVPSTIGPIFFIHLAMVSLLLIYFPFSKLMHFAGVFMSPTRNLANTNRVKRHVNPWNPEVKTHTYQEWEDEFRDVMKACELPLEKE